jgi:hypothetical protein
MGIARSSLVVGPAKCVFNSATFFTKENFEIKPAIRRFDVRPLGFTQADVRDEDRMVEFGVTPDGRWSAAVIAALWPYLNAVPGASMGGAADLPFVAHGADGALATVLAAHVSKMPSLTFSARQSLIGEAGFTGLIVSGGDPDDADAYLTYAASGGTFADSTFVLSAIKTQPYSAVWTGVTGFGALQGEEGFTVDFDLQTGGIPLDGLGTVDNRVQSVGIMVRCKPVGPTAAQILSALRLSGTGNALGSSRQANAAQLQITGADGINYLTIPKATLVEAGYRFGSDVLRNGEIGFVATLNPSTGAQTALATLAAS